MFDLLSDRLSQHLEQIVRERNPFFSSQGHFYVREYLRQELGNWGKVESHFFPFQGKVYENLILDLPNNSQKPPILIGAHYDTVPGSPGADDNATGLAVLLELARFFGENQANYPIRLIAFDLEEYGLLGSIAYAEKLKQTKQDLRLMLSLEMLGYCDQNPHSQKYPAFLKYFYPNTGDFIALIGNLKTRKDLNFLSRVLRENQTPCEWLPVIFGGYIVPDTRRSDHSPFWSRGYSAIMVTDTANMRNPYYHSSGDTIATLDLNFLTRVCQGLCLGLQSLPMR
ncbi:MAG: M28 family peptidase [Microcystis wesenbergii Mw_QC_S_20081001_S30D]|jgi:Zn-dependent M28 family amino/carboxypeptidase|uniref:M28 family peptidase n=1 Tax=Microcystis wesenbergii Mw_QC_S_20081001_S30D TaxID=2486245 RepID=A0A552JJW9_9CHRO|nr:MAG: M28 family peptidase [Microcystis wesenbergii Mw_QC_S_20081001_S30D]TRV03240.1 MAG: M28 family peptidase [Microcystis wesenbergii Mw_QC_S_20081001_S30]TRV05040.1 MAG: M28 family peptidase [Microcystis wesenbergii Mw_QC_B_20070930_S4D]TRV08128.1 MAG: M28 family peptidase [Microcystis wesenbergii Mw_QC_B_20070930_S4]